MKTLNLCLVILFSLLFVGCSLKSPQSNVIERDNVNILTNTSDLQMTFLKKQGELERYCASRPSDVADTRSSGVTLGGSLIGEAANIGEGNSESALSLGGRNPAVLIVREMLYRACELSMNLNADTDTSIAIYSKFLDSIEKITTVQTGTGVASLGQKANSTVTMTENSSKAATVSDSTSTSTSTGSETTSTDDSSTEN